MQDTEEILKGEELTHRLAKKGQILRITKSIHIKEKT